jgi:glutamate-5-semialdehyde dehydrogenase
MSSDQKNRVLAAAAKLLVQSQERVLKANQKDLAEAKKNQKNGKQGPAFLDRLLLTPERIRLIAEGMTQVMELPDPVGEVPEAHVLSNGLKLNRVRSPLGVIFLIFESRPNVAMEAFSLAFKAGNAIILKGGKESNRTTQVFYEILEEAFQNEGLSKKLFWGLSGTDRTHTQFLLSQKKWIDVVVPRGGEKLIEFVTKYSQIPMIKNDRGLCHVYLHLDADLQMAMKVVINAKTQRPGVCNSMETLLVHREIAPQFLPMLYAQMASHSVRWVVCAKARQMLKGLKVEKATEKSWDTEYLDFVMNCKVVDSMDDAIAHIDAHGSGHSEAILTGSPDLAKKFQLEVDAAAVYWNASTRFTDGFEFGLGGELGISTQKLHVRGPVGLRELTSMRWVIDGNGQTRG